LPNRHGTGIQVNGAAPSLLDNPYLVDNWTGHGEVSRQNKAIERLSEPTEQAVIFVFPYS